MAWTGFRGAGAALLAVLGLSSPAWAQRTPAEGFLLKVEGNAIAGFGAQATSFEVTSGDGDARQAAFSTQQLFVGPAGALNFGYAPSRELRLGVRGAYQHGFAVVTGDSLPYTGIEEVGQWVVGPTLGFRSGPRSPVELELGVGFVLQQFGGQQALIAAPDNGYPLGADQYGVNAIGRFIWRPGGAGHGLGIQLGVNATWAMTTANATDTHGLVIGPEAGLVVGF